MKKNQQQSATQFFKPTYPITHKATLLSQVEKNTFCLKEKS